MKSRVLLLLSLSLGFSTNSSADLFLVTTKEGPGFSTPEEVIQVLQQGIIPTFDYLIDLKKKKKLVAGGLPVGSRKFTLIVEADSNAEVDRMLRDIPAWGMLSWKVTPLESIEGRAQKERAILKSLRPED